MLEPQAARRHVDQDHLSFALGPPVALGSGRERSGQEGEGDDDAGGAEAERRPRPSAHRAWVHRLAVYPDRGEPGRRPG